MHMQLSYWKNEENNSTRSYDNGSINVEKYFVWMMTGM